MFLHYVLQLNENEMLSRFFYAQWVDPSRNDWVLSVLEDMKDIQLELTIEEIKEKSDYVFNPINHGGGAIWPPRR